MWAKQALGYIRTLCFFVGLQSLLWAWGIPGSSLSAQQIFFLNSEDKKFIDKEKGLQEGKRKQTSQRKDNIPAATIICHILEST